MTNLSAMGRDEAEDFLARRRGRVCVTFVPAPGGGAASREELQPAQRRGSILRGLGRAAGFLVGLTLLVPGCRPAQDQVLGDLGPQELDPRSDPADGDAGQIVGRISAQPRCSVEDQRFVMGEMALGEPLEQAPAGVEDALGEQR